MICFIQGVIQKATPTLETDNIHQNNEKKNRYTNITLKQKYFPEEPEVAKEQLRKWFFCYLYLRL